MRKEHDVVQKTQFRFFFDSEGIIVFLMECCCVFLDNDINNEQ